MSQFSHVTTVRRYQSSSFTDGRTHQPRLGGSQLDSGRALLQSLWLLWLSLGCSELSPPPQVSTGLTSWNCCQAEDPMQLTTGKDCRMQHLPRGRQQDRAAAAPSTQMESTRTTLTLPRPLRVFLSDKSHRYTLTICPLDLDSRLCFQAY